MNSENNMFHINCKTEGMSPNLTNRIKALTNSLNQPIIQLKKIRAFLAEGIPDQAAQVRQYAWKVVLGYLPKFKIKWEEQINKQEEVYQNFIKQYLPSNRFQEWPIKISKGEEGWEEHEKDFLLWQQIQKDTSRTQSQLSFFSGELFGLQLPYLTPSRREKHRLIHGEHAHLKERSSQKRVYRYDYMTRILFIFAKLNPRAEYVQGMNEVLAPIFYLVNNRRKDIDQSACFFMFNNVMTDLIQLNIPAFDQKDNGIHAKIREINKILLATQPRLWKHMQKVGIDPFFYCFRWMTLLFAQEFELFQTLRIWESIFSFEDRAGFANHFVVSILCNCKEQLMLSDYGQIMVILKHIREHINLSDTIFRASEMYHQFRGVDISAVANRNLQRLKKAEREGSVSRKAKSLVNFIKKIL